MEILFLKMSKKVVFSYVESGNNFHTLDNEV